MTELRKQLQAARSEHRSAHYPGDLAREVLPAERPSRLRWAMTTIGAMAAAAVVAAVLLRSPHPGARRHHGQPTPTVRDSKPLPHGLSRAVEQVPQFPDAPSLPARPPLSIPGPLLPGYPDLRAPSMPAAPQWPARVPPLPTSQPEFHDGREAT